MLQGQSVRWTLRLFTFAFLGLVVLSVLPGEGVAEVGDDMLATTFGGCDFPSASCFLNDACVQENGTWFYYHYMQHGLGANANGDSSTSNDCFYKDRWNGANCTGTPIGSTHFDICT